MICIAANSGGKGGVAGGAGASGQASLSAAGAGSAGYGYPVIELTTGMAATLTVQLTQDTNGEVPADLSTITSMQFKASPTKNSSDKAITLSCTYTTTGAVSLTFTAAQTTGNNGLWYAEFLGYNGTTLTQVYPAYLCIRKGLVGGSTGADTVTAMDVRQALMDTSAEANQLIDDLEFSDVLIYNAIERCLNEWNETPPELDIKYDATSFPYKEHLIKGAVGYLMQMVAFRYTRNRMTYSASGFSQDTNDKGPMYIQQANMARQEWKNFVNTKKTELNMLECMGTFSIPYFDNRIW